MARPVPTGRGLGLLFHVPMLCLALATAGLAAWSYFVEPTWPLKFGSAVALAEPVAAGGPNAVAPEPASDLTPVALAQASPKPKRKPVHNFENKILPFFAEYCSDCHNTTDDAAGGIAFDKYTSHSDLLADYKNWKRILRMVENRAMPPSDYDPKPSASEMEFVSLWLDDALHNFDCSTIEDPGRPTIQRLNRAEYNNTIRDLTGLDLRPADQFPSDDVGEGFDNIGDVLTLPPLLMEKYLDAAEMVASAVVLTKTPAPITMRRDSEDLDQSSGAFLRPDGFHVLSQLGDVSALFTVPVSGEYKVRIEAAAVQAGSEKLKLGLRVDSKQVATETIKSHLMPSTIEITTRLGEGTRRLSVRLNNPWVDKKAKDAGKPRSERFLGIRSIELVGPHKFDKPNAKSKAHRRVVSTNAGNAVEDSVRKVMRDFATRAFRRPVTQKKLNQLVTLVTDAIEDGHSYEEGIRAGVQTVLVSPQFLFRVESDHQKSGDYELDHFELASRLSYFLWSSMPDGRLMSLAEQKKLHEPKILEQQVKRMLKDERSQALVDNFAAQWLNLRNLDEITPDTNRFPSWSPDLRNDMRHETERLVQEIFRGDRSILEFLNARFTFVNERLAAHYGLPNVRGDSFKQVTLDKTQRMGVLTHGSILALTSNPTRTSPVKRGKWILENILGAEPPPPPPDVPELEETSADNPDLSLREQLAKHRADPGCAACHKTMDVLGFGFENFDAVGVWRESDGDDPIDATGDLPGAGHFEGPTQLIQLLQEQRNEFCEAMTARLLTYALGRGLEYYDRCTIDSIVGRLQRRNYRFSILVSGIVTSDAFLRRRAAGGRVALGK